MAGIIVPVLEKRIFEYSFLTSGAEQDVVIHPAIDVGAWYRVRLVVLVHQLTAVSTGAGAGAHFKFLMFHTFPSENDRQLFQNADSGDEFLATPEIVSSGGVGSPGNVTSTDNIRTQSATDPQAYLRLVLRAKQNATPTTLYGEFSAYLVLRDS